MSPLLDPADDGRPACAPFLFRIFEIAMPMDDRHNREAMSIEEVAAAESLHRRIVNTHVPNGL
jgi:hypothetical protein